MNLEIFGRLLKKAFELNVRIVISSELGRNTPSCVDVAEKKIIINTNYKKRKQLPLHLAHEMAHILNGDDMIKQLYCSVYRHQMEYNADNLAIRLLLKECLTTPLSGGGKRPSKLYERIFDT